MDGMAGNAQTITNAVTGHLFWSLLAAAVVVWYSTITIYVAIRGASDIKHMLARLEEMRKSQ
jgi:hypothetical protein